MSAEMHHPWEAIYRDAVLETDHRKLIRKIDAANMILCQRVAELGSSNRYGQREERQRLSNALLTLDTIRRIELRMPV
jgi:hypothetical protein